MGNQRIAGYCSLSRVGQVELLVSLPHRSVIPRSVTDELLRAPEDDPARRAIEGGIFKIWVAVLDDGAARRCARSLSLMITGTLAVVLLAKQHGLIDSASQVLHDLRSRFSPR